VYVIGGRSSLVIIKERCDSQMWEMFCTKCAIFKFAFKFYEDISISYFCAYTELLVLTGVERFS